MHSPSIAQAQKLAPESPEFKQLEAMGYELHPRDKGISETSVFTNGPNLLNVSKNETRTALWRAYNRKRLNSAQETELLKIVNQFNVDTTYQVALTPESLNFCLYIYGPHNPRVFALVVRLLERVDTALDRSPELFQLLND